jgi:hypothetical protein
VVNGNIDSIYHSKGILGRKYSLYPYRFSKGEALYGFLGWLGIIYRDILYNNE